MTAEATRPIDRSKLVFFSLAAAALTAALWADDRFLFNPGDPHWKHIEPFKWVLLPHGVFGAIALFSGASQFSDRLRQSRPMVHRWLGRAYLTAVTIAAPLAVWIGAGPFQPATIRVEQWFQGGLWWLCAAIALVCILRRRVELHKRWMMRSYGFTLVFVTARVPDLFIPQMSDQMLSDLLWGLVVIALFAPDLALSVRDLWRTRASARPMQRAA